jgi:prepilin-type processing-associated H-X9-DG protein
VLVCLGVLFALFLPLFPQERRRVRSPCHNNLKQIGLALHNYQNVYKSFPPAFVLGPDGTPWHSWRVLILPFLEQKPLAEEYRFDEPWNGANNSKLLDQRPGVFACRSFDGGPFVPKTDTTYVAVIGPETAWPAATAIGVRDISDGTSTTALVIEVRDAGIPWLAPHDLTFEEASVQPSEEKGRRPSSNHMGGCYVLFADGRVTFINPAETNLDIWNGFLTRAGGEVINDF